MDLLVKKRIIEWIVQRLKEGACMMVASHSLEPFLELAASAITFIEGQTLLFKPLPANLEEKLCFLENLAKGIYPE